MSFKTLVRITNSLIDEYPTTKEWHDSSFSWIRELSPASKGAIGRHIGSGLLYAYGFTPGATGKGLKVNGQGVLVRVATKWKSNDVKFQNIRDIEFDHVLCIGLYPQKAFAWLIPKHEIWLREAVRTDRPGINPQHKGADAWLTVDPEHVPAWLTPYGGTVDDMIKVANSNL